SPWRASNTCSSCRVVRLRVARRIAHLEFWPSNGANGANVSGCGLSNHGSAVKHFSVTARDNRSLSLEPYVLVRSGERIAGDQPETRLLPSRPVAAHQAHLHDRRDHRLLVHELLDTVQRRLAPLLVELGALLAEEPVDVRVAAVHVRAAGRDEGLDPRRG